MARSPAVAGAGPAAAGRRSFADREGWLGRLMVAPALVYIALFVGGPLLLAVAFSFSDLTVGDQSFNFVGLENFRKVMRDPVFRRALANSVVMTLTTLTLVVVLSKILALVLTQNFRGKWVVRFLVLMPWTTPVSLAAVTWLWMLDSLFSPIDWVLRRLGLIQSSLNWLANPKLAMVSVIGVQTWRLVPLAAVIMMGGISAIPQEVKEAAEVDGAGFFRRLFEVIIPLSAPVTAVAVLFGAVVIFTDMAVVYVLTRGGPINATQTLASWAYYRGIQGGDIGQGAAIALFLLPVLVAASVLILKAVRRMEIV